MKTRIQRSCAKVKTLVLATKVTCLTKPLPAIGGRETAKWPQRGAAACLFKRETNGPLDARSGIDRGLDSHFLGCSLAREPPCSDVEVFVVLADDDHVDVVGPLAFDRALNTRIEMHGPQVDILVEVESEAEQDSLLENAGGDVGVADRTEQDDVATAEPLDFGVGQNVSGSQVILAPQVKGNGLEVEALDSGNGGEYEEGLGRYLRAHTIARHDAQLDQNTLHVNSFESKTVAKIPIVTIVNSDS